jgi:F-type H+-transporting ATPase subunit b
MLRLSAILFSLSPSLALAAEGHHAEQHGIPWATLIFSTINFVIFFWVMKRFAWPAVRSWVEDRRSDVVKALEEAGHAKEEADRLKAEWERRLATLSEEIEAMRRQARVEIDRERDKILASARKAADGIREDARRLADQEVREAQVSLRQEVARQAFEIAGRMTVERLTAADQSRFFDEFLNKVNA